MFIHMICVRVCCRDNFATLNQRSQEQGAMHEQREDKAMQIQYLNQEIDSEHNKISQNHNTWSMKKESMFEEIKQNKQ